MSSNDINRVKTSVQDAFTKIGNAADVLQKRLDDTTNRTLDSFYKVQGVCDAVDAACNSLDDLLGQSTNGGPPLEETDTPSPPLDHAGTTSGANKSA